VKLVFVCPNENKVFESSNYEIIENKGIITDAAGNKVLDAKVVLNESCPYCCQKHIYHVGELSCPFSR
jgi:Fe2+ or Zn2+ uptake regulation protein